MFEVDAAAYDRFMGQYSTQLAPQLADLAGVRAGQRVLDVGCGPGALVAELVERVGEDSVAAVDPSEPFVAAARERFPGLDVQTAGAERLPYEDGRFDATLAQLVVQFVPDPVAGLREMQRVTARDGTVVACVWDHEGGRSPLAVYWRAARELDPSLRDEADAPGARKGDLRRLFVEAGLSSVEESTVEATRDFARFAEWWDLFTLGVGPAGAHAQSLSAKQREQVRARCEQLLPPAPFTLTCVAWAARARA